LRTLFIPFEYVPERRHRIKPNDYTLSKPEIMNKAILFILIAYCTVSCNTKTATPLKTASGMQPIDTSDMTNNFYDNSETYQLPMKELTITGEISNPGKVDFSALPVRSVIVKEALLDSSGSDRFIGTYRYDGYSLFDALNDRILKKANNSEFSPIIDLFVEIENDKGEKVVFSWGEIYYPNNLHRILITSSVSRIVPSKTRDLWPLPQESRLVAANDLVTERNISSPVKITVRSYPLSFMVDRNMQVMFSPDFKIYKGIKLIGTIRNISPELRPQTFNTIFYGRGRGIHSTMPFTGVLLKEVLLQWYPFTSENLRSGIICLTGKDGYRCSFSYSEIFNRNDQQELLLIKTGEEEDGGMYRVFAACDFFSDRAVKSLSEIHLGY
jgi:hypothetical protein